MRAPLRLALAWVGCCLCSVTHASATGPADEESIEEVTVTAQRRVEYAQDVPMTVTSISEDDLSTFGVANLESVTMLTSGFVVNKVFGIPLPFIRGTGSPLSAVGTDPAVALYIDGIYQPRAWLYRPYLLDFESIQILKGPQGSLYGRNATAGAVLATTKKPAPGFDAEVQGTYGNADKSVIQGYIGGGNETISASLAAYDLESDGFYENLLTGNDKFEPRDEWAARVKVLVNVGDASELLLSADYMEAKIVAGHIWSQLGTNNVTASIVPGARYTSEPHKTYASRSDEDRLLDINSEESTGVSARWKTAFDGFDLSLVGGVREAKRREALDFDASSAELLFAADTDPSERAWGDDNEIGSIEAVVSSSGAGALEWMVGAAYEEMDSVSNVIIDAFSSGKTYFTTHLKNTAVSAFADVGYSFGTDDRWKVNVAARLINDEKERTQAEIGLYAPSPPTSPIELARVPFADADKDWTEPVYTASVRYRLSEPATAYFRFSQGFRSGSYSHVNYAAPPVDPETADSYALGIKTEFLGGKLTANSEIFFSKVQDLQVQGLDATFGGINTNAAEGEVRGIDGQVSVRSSSGLFSLTLDVTHLAKAEFTSYPEAFALIPCPNLGIDVPANCVPGDPTGPAAALPKPDLSGNDLTRAPEFSSSLSAMYVIPTAYGTWELGAVANYTSDYKFDPVNRLEQDSLTIVNATMTFRAERFRGLYLTCWVNNATDEEYWDTIDSIQVGDYAAATDPRTYGLTVGYRLGHE